MCRLLFAATLLLSACAREPAVTGEAPGCPPAGYSRESLAALKSSEWAIADAAARNTFGRELTACLASPDPALRDGVAFEGLQYLLRNRQVSDDAMMALQDDLEARLVAPEGQGFERPFAALVLAEVARADRIQSYLTPERRQRLIDSGTAYLRSVRDYRGFDEREGWRHGVAHAADLMLQLTLNPSVERTGLERIRDAVASQVAPPDHAYVHGESERLLAPILYMARRGIFSESEWTAWFAEIAAPAPFDSWDGTFTSPAKLRKRHNLTAFVALAYVEARLSENSADDVLIPGAEAARRALP